MDAVFGFVVNNCDVIFPAEFGITFGRGQFASVTLASEFGLIPQGESNYGYAMLPAFASLGGDVPDGYGVGSAELPAFTSTSSGGFYIPPDPVVGYAEIPRFSTFGLVITSSPGDGDSTLPAFQSIGGEGHYGIGESTIHAVQSYAIEGPPPGTANAITAVYLFDGIGVGHDHIVFLNWDGQIVDTVSGNRILIDSIIVSLEISDTYSVLGSFLASALESLAINDAAVASVGSGTTFSPSIDSDGRVWVVNIDTSATSQYDDYGFNSFFERDGEYYGVADDGIYKLDGDDDAGVDIDALVDFGRDNYGDRRMKKTGDVYVGVGTDGTVFLRTITDGTTRTYSLKTSSTSIKDHRALVGKNIAGNHWGFELVNDAGADFELESIEFKLIPLSRAR